MCDFFPHQRNMLLFIIKPESSKWGQHCQLMVVTQKFKVAQCTCCGLTGKSLPFEKWMDIGQCQRDVLNYVGLKGQCFFEMVFEQMGQSFFELVKAHAYTCLAHNKPFHHVKFNTLDNVQKHLLTWKWKNQWEWVMPIDGHFKSPKIGDHFLAQQSVLWLVRKIIAIWRMDGQWPMSTNCLKIWGVDRKVLFVQGGSI